MYGKDFSKESRSLAKLLIDLLSDEAKSSGSDFRPVSVGVIGEKWVFNFRDSVGQKARLVADLGDPTRYEWAHDILAILDVQQGLCESEITWLASEDR